MDPGAETDVFRPSTATRRLLAYMSRHAAAEVGYAASVAATASATAAAAAASDWMASAPGCATRDIFADLACMEEAVVRVEMAGLAGVFGSRMARATVSGGGGRGRGPEGREPQARIPSGETLCIAVGAHNSLRKVLDVRDMCLVVERVPPSPTATATATATATTAAGTLNASATDIVVQKQAKTFPARSTDEVRLSVTMTGVGLYRITGLQWLVAPALRVTQCFGAGAGAGVDMGVGGLGAGSRAGALALETLGGSPALSPPPRSVGGRTDTSPAPATPTHPGTHTSTPPPSVLVEVVPAFPLLEVCFLDIPREALAGQISGGRLRICNRGSVAAAGLLLKTSVPFCVVGQPGSAPARGPSSSPPPASLLPPLGDSCTLVPLPPSLVVAPGEEVVLPVWVRIPEAVVAASARAFRNDSTLVVGLDWVDVGPELEPCLDDFPGLGRYFTAVQLYLYSAQPPLQNPSF